MTKALQRVADPFCTQFERRADGTLLLRPQGTLPESPARLMDFLEHWARLAPERILVARRAASGEWQRMHLVAALYAPVRVAHIIDVDDLSSV